MFAFALACALWDHNPLLNHLHRPCRSTSLTELLDGLCLHFRMLTSSDQIAIPCRHSDFSEDLHTAKQERDTAQQKLDRVQQELYAVKQELDRTTKDLQATNIVLSEQLGLSQAQLQQVGLPLCSTGQCWAGSLIVASKLHWPAQICSLETHAHCTESPVCPSDYQQIHRQCITWSLQLRSPEEDACGHSARGLSNANSCERFLSLCWEACEICGAAGLPCC